MKNLFRNKEIQFNELLFEGRNKDYGAYVMRSEADRVLTKSMFLGIGLFTAIALIPLAISSLNRVNVIQESPPTPPVWVPIDDPIPPTVTPPPATVVPPKQVETFNSSVPTPKKIVKKETPAATIDKYDKAVAGTDDIKGNPPIVNYPPPAITPTAPAMPATPTPAPTVDLNKIADKVDVEASFTGGINSFRSKVVGNFDTSSFEGTGEVLKTTITFIVERDGTISNIKATGPDSGFNREAERTIKNVRGKWIPAKVKGEAVRSYFKFPVSMMFE